MFCSRVFNDGSIVAAHSNQLRDGKGKGIKANDYMVAYLCYRCHVDIDERRVDDPNGSWDYAWRNTIKWLFDKGHIKIQ